MHTRNAIARLAHPTPADRRHKSLRFTVVAVWILAACLTPPAALAQPLQQRLNALIKQATLGPARIGVIVTDAFTDETLASVSADSAFIPASNMKLLTSGAATIALGADHRFRTELKRKGDQLYVIGTGDPAFGDPVLLREMGIDVDEFLARWVRAVQQSGGGPIREVVIDDLAFEPAGPHATWPRDQLNRWYCAEVGGLNFFTNVIDVYASPTTPGSSPRIKIEPDASWLVPKNRASTVATGANTVWVSRSLMSNRMTLHGEVRAAMGLPIPVAVHDPSMVFGQMFADRLEAANLGSPKARRLGREEPVVDAKTIAVVTTPIETILRRCNTDSYNLYAECLLKRMGAVVTGEPGSWDNGQAVLRMTIADVLGPSAVGAPGSLMIVDGSGMSRANRVTPRLLADWLEVIAHRDEPGLLLWGSLPRAGKDGTLVTRFHNMGLVNPVRAKSGYLDRVSCLTGYVGDPTQGA